MNISALRLLIYDKYGKDFNAFSEITHTIIKTHEYLNRHDNILVAYSGGSDSDCVLHLLCTYFNDYLYKIHFVFSDTGIEYKATRKHICDIAKKYNVNIVNVRGKSVVTCCREYGVPMLNKSKSKALSMYLRDTPKGHYLVFENNGAYFGFTEKERLLAKYCKDNNIKVSEKCCEYAKKKPMKTYAKNNKIDLTITGERKAEGGLRAIKNASCFSIHKNGDHKFMPIFWWSDNTKKIFKEFENIRYSDCYEIYGMKRTGCVGCPFGRNTADELKTMSIYEHDLYKLCLSVFGTAYQTMDMFNVRKHKCLFFE